MGHGGPDRDGVARRESLRAPGRVTADYAPRSGSLVFYPGQAARQVYVTVYGDTEPEGSEVFLVRLAEADGAVIAKDLGHGVIRDRDFTAPRVKCDADGDGASDLFVRYSSLGDGAAPVPLDHKNSHVVWSPQATLAEPRDLLTGSHPWHLVATDDFNGDRICDLVWEHGETVAFTITGPDGRFRPPTPADGSVARPAPEWTLVGAGDFAGTKGDGRCSGGTARRARSAYGRSARRARRPGSSKIPIVGRPPDSPWQPAAVADLDGDGGADILWGDAVSGSLEYWRMVGLHSVGTVPLAPGSTDMDVTWRLVAAGDFNGDGTDDVLWEQPIERPDGLAAADGPTRRTRIWLSRRRSSDVVEAPFTPEQFDVASPALHDGTVVAPR